MPRLVFPDDQLVYALQGNFFIGKPGTQVLIYTDALATVLADIQDMANGAIAGSLITVDSNSLLPLFQGPNDGRDTLYAKPVGGSAAQPIYARVDDRLDTINTQLSGAVSCKAYRNAALNVPNAALTAIALDAEVFDTAAMHDLVTNPSRITVPRTKKYSVSAGMRFAAGVVGNYRAIQIRLNGVSVAANWTTPGSAAVLPSVTVSDVLNCAATDYIEVWAYQDSGGALALVPGNDTCWLSVAELVGA